MVLYTSLSLGDWNIKTTTPSMNSISEKCVSKQDSIGDGYCDDALNNKDCNHDGGDCCGSNVNTQFCFECQCFG